MARQPRFEYPGAIYHVMARGNGGDAVFVADDDRKSFLCGLGQVCASHGWKVHAWVLMSNHFHLLLETPQANLVTGMKQLLATLSSLAMGHPGSVSRIVSAGISNTSSMKTIRKLEKVLIREL